MINVNMCPVVDFDEIEAELNISRDKYASLFDVENGHYKWFGTDEDYLSYREEALNNELKFIKDYPECKDDLYITRLENDIMLTKKFREMGYEDGIIIFVWW